MPILKVVKPFILRISGNDAAFTRREFTVGEHQVGQAELGHWFVQACIKDGRAFVLADAEHGTEAQGGTGRQSVSDDNQAAAGSTPLVYSEAELKKLKRDDLEAIAEDLGLRHEGLPNKDAIVGLILEHQSGGAPGEGD